MSEYPQGATVLIAGTGGAICTCYEAGRNPSCPSHGMTAGVVPDPPATRWVNPPADEEEVRDWAPVDVEELEVLLLIAAEYRQAVVSDGRPRMKQRKLLDRLEVLRAR